MCQMEPENEIYRQWNTWLEENYSVLKETVEKETTAFRMGIRFVTCGRGAQ